MQLKEAVVHANVLRTYTAEQKHARSQFLKEIQSLQPEGIHGGNKSRACIYISQLKHLFIMFINVHIVVVVVVVVVADQLSNEEINSLLLHAHKRVLQMQRQIEKCQVCATRSSFHRSSSSASSYYFIFSFICVCCSFLQLEQNKQVQAALEEQAKQNADVLKAHEASLYELHRKEFALEKDKLVRITYKYIKTVTNNNRKRKCHRIMICCCCCCRMVTVCLFFF